MLGRAYLLAFKKRTCYGSKKIFLYVIENFKDQKGWCAIGLLLKNQNKDLRFVHCLLSSMWSNMNISCSPVFPIKGGDFWCLFFPLFFLPDVCLKVVYGFTIFFWYLCCLDLADQSFEFCTYQCLYDWAGSWYTCCPGLYMIFLWEILYESWNCLSNYIYLLF